LALGADDIWGALGDVEGRGVGKGNEQPLGVAPTELEVAAKHFDTEEGLHRFGRSVVEGASQACDPAAKAALCDERLVNEVRGR